MPYIGTQPKDVRSFGRAKFDFTATQGQTAFTGADDDSKTLGFTDGQIEVYVNGILMDESDFTTSNSNTVTLASAANLNDIISIVALQTDIPNSDYVPASGGTFSGNVGIGATTIDEKLHLENNDTTTTFIKTQNSAGSMIVGNNSAGNSYVSSQAGGKPLIFETENNEKMRINHYGQVGINTTTPDANSFGAGHGILAVASDTGSAKTAMINIIGDGNDTSGTRVASLFFNDASAVGAGATLAGVEAYRATNNATDPGADMVFSTNSNGGAYTEKMRISSEGYTTKPNQPAFYVRHTAAAAYSSAYITNWATVTYNIGNHFNTSTGTFTSPCAGIYQLNAMIGNNYGYNSSTAYGNYKVRVNGIDYNGFNWDPYANQNTWATSILVGMVKLNANDTVRIYVAGLGYPDNADWTSWSMCLLA